MPFRDGISGVEISGESTLPGTLCAGNTGTQQGLKKGKKMGKLTEALLCIEVDTICVAVLVIVAAKASAVGFDKPIKNKLFERALWFAVAANVMDMIWSLHIDGYLWLGGGLSWLINAAYFALLELSAFSWFVYACVVESWDILHDRRKFLLCAIPMWILFALLIVSAFNGCIFSVDAAGVYHRGPLFFMQPLLSYGYVVYTMIKSIQVVLTRKNSATRREYLVIASFGVPMLLCGVLQQLLPRLPVAAVGVALSYLLVYMNSLQLMVSLDPVTGISDRRQFLLSLHSRADSLRPQERLFFLFIDVDDFKGINDVYGHDEGDRVLRIVADALREVCAEHNASFGRYGGDEFTVAYVVGEEKSEKAICHDLREVLNQRLASGRLMGRVGLSIGQVEFRRGEESIQDLITRADREMYLEKERKAQIRQEA